MKLPANTALPPAQTDVKAALDKAHGIWNPAADKDEAQNLTIDGRSLNITAPGAKQELAIIEAKATALEAKGDKAGATDIRQKLAKYQAAFEKQDRDALLATFENRDLEKAKLAELKPAERQQQYVALSHVFENDPQALLGLQTLLLSGKLTAEPKNKDGLDLLGALDVMGKTTMKAPLNTGSMLGETVREIANPSSIRQEGVQTCSAASLAIMTATQRPAEYARLLTGLAKQGTGEVTLVNGKTLQRVPDSEQDLDKFRTGTQELWQAAFMDFEAKQLDGEAFYEPANDTIYWKDHESTTGIEAQGMLEGMKAITGDGATKLDSMLASTMALNQVIRACEEHPGAKYPITLGTDYDKEGAPKGTVEAKIVGFDQTKKVFKVEVNGKATTMTADQLRARMQKLDVPPVTHAQTHAPIPGRPYDREAGSDLMFKHVQQAIADKDKHKSLPIVMLRQGEFAGATGGTGKGAEASHFVTVTDIRGGQVYFTNSTGTEEHMPEAAFKNRLWSSTVGAPRA